ncbi:MAG: 16S rRNA (cytosine(967)-C(5))-methyltransferase RsmB [Gammaproteobacteria bacterium]|nr:16S rRNA (cytosine(967)-C(5))-methyltransferase RsmB [Gammaproteobacteria bacterium]
MNPRVISSQVLDAVLHHGIALNDSLTTHLAAQPAREHAFIQALCYGVLRDWPRPQVILDQLLEKPLRRDAGLLECLLLGGIYELRQMDTAAYAAVSQTVEASSALQFRWARGLVNAVLRNLQRQGPQLESHLNQSSEARYAHPSWLLEPLQRDWPAHWHAIVAANNTQAPMVLRVNQLQQSRAAYLTKLVQQQRPAQVTPHSATGIRLLHACDVNELPGFNQGEVSVQDTAAQLVAPLLHPQPGERILDACAAPGGKTLHLLELQPRLHQLVALDNDAARLQRVEANLRRAGLSATLVQGDAADPTLWWDRRPFDRILIDAPCSATGVIRRHPDIKVLRRASDLAKLAEQQQQILQALWPLLSPGGMLVYSTCSVLTQENDAPLEKFLATHADATLDPIRAEWGHPTRVGRQLLPGEDDMDGFYYARLQKLA